LWTLASAAILVIVGVIAYANSFSGAFVFDDKGHILERLIELDAWSVGDLVQQRRPVLFASLALNFAVGGVNTWGYHLFNVIVHVAAALTLFGVVRRTAVRVGQSGESALGFALATALIWTAHPLQTQSVTYVIQRSESMMGLFYLLTLYAAIRAVDSPRRLAWSAVAVMSCLLGMGSKPAIITIPFVVWMYDAIFLNDSWRAALRDRWKLYVALSATSVWLVATGVLKNLFLPSAGPEASVGFGVQDHTAIEYLLSQPGVILHYLQLSYWPMGQCLDYGWPVARTNGEIVPQAAVVLGLLSASAWGAWRRRWWGFVGMWFFVILAPTSSFIPIRDLMYEHRMYLPLASVIVLTLAAGVWFTQKLAANQRLLRVGLQLAMTLAIVTALTTATTRRNKVYASDLTMWQNVVATNPDHFRALDHLAAALLRDRRYEEAVLYGMKAVAIRPDFANAHANLGAAYTELGRLNDAFVHLGKALSLQPEHYRAHYTMGLALTDAGRLDEALESLDSAIEIKPDLDVAHYQRGRVLTHMERHEDAVESYRLAIRWNPDFATAYVNLGNALSKIGRDNEAEDVFRNAIDVSMRVGSIYAGSRAHFNLANAMMRRKATEEAIIHYTSAGQLDPNYYLAHHWLGTALEVAQRFPDAKEAYERALAIKPGSPETLIRLEACRIAISGEPVPIRISGMNEE
jgi:tetratricopeptide (TPR) repeat protein